MVAFHFKFLPQNSCIIKNNDCIRKNDSSMKNNNFTNVEVSSGKIINDGNNSLVTFVTIPGLKE